MNIIYWIIATLTMFIFLLCAIVTFIYDIQFNKEHKEIVKLLKERGVKEDDKNRANRIYY